ncbi:FAD-binding and (Fe-S)-binding domain-containing protein [Nakamurella sp. PAMC28650]|uniref:FAD-binding and (Fe-S)-binding domain-containing protein n=1 Tax=Nakamurella sp. PAMC28650 TaxID=2762325 RepID=UPI00164E9E0E|nr:FAD-binding and (Fe-S)-binding domain-containing protein [Nakamurella sp. PAMC28650]QNK82262.1 FAD-binding oxidoreductase [Nakamurella sp. PAMC28650]
MTADLAARLRTELRGAVSDGRRRRAEYSSDAGNYRVVPQVVVEPVDIDDVLATLAVSRETAVPVTSRGGGTSVAGNAVGTGIVIDFARHLNRILDIDTVGRTALVEPGVILSDLQEQLAPLGLRFGPDPSTQTRATLGGMIGNNACGPHALAYGRTADNVEALTVIDGSGREIKAGPGSSRSHAAEQVPGLDVLVDAHLEVIRTELGRFPRQVSGYSLEHLLPERGRNLARALVGTEGTLATTIDATLRLVPISPARMLVVLGYRDMVAAADAVPALLAHHPAAIEGMDARLVDVVRRSRGPSSVPDLPRGGGWLMVEMSGDSIAAATASARSMIRDSAAEDSMVFAPGPAATAIWRIREDGAGLAGRTAQGRQAWPGWEDAAVPPANLGGYLRAFESLMESYGVTGLPYGHFGDGCIHVRIDLPLEDHPERLRQFVFDAAHLVVAHGGSCSGEHGDGRARGELLPIMYSPEVIDLFAAVKALFDPADLLNPGVLVRPRPLDADLRRPHARSLTAQGGFSFGADDGDFTKAVHRCVGVGKCRADDTAAGGFMCPSYLASRDEKDVTRGRARVLQELTNGELIPDFASREVHESLDLCLSCKACASDCPAGVDMAKYKAEVLHRRYRRRLRPISHYSLGWLPRWLSGLDRIPRLGPAMVNGALRSAPLAQIVLRAGGMDPRRQIPRFAPVGFTRWWRRELQRRNVFSPTAARDEAWRGPVLLWADSFTDGLDPGVGRAAATVLTAAGYRVIVPQRKACCGLTWITTGQLTGARRRLLQLLDILGPFAAQGIPIVGLEPSCTAVLRSDLKDLLPDDPRTAVVSAATKTLAEVLTETAGWRPPDLSGTEVLVQPHCHHHAVMGFATDRRLLERSGADVTGIAGCCGLAGNFGMEAGHYDMSLAVAENALLPALRDRAETALVLADGFSCRTQADQLAGVRPIHLAELLARHLPDESG